MYDLEPVRRRWLEERPRYEEFAEYVARGFAKLAQGQGIQARVTNRAKTVDSLLKKALKNSYQDPFEEIEDKAGVRVVVRFTDELERVEQIAKSTFEVTNVEHKLEELGAERVGYQDVQLHVRLRDDDGRAQDFEGLSCEVQVRTMAQDLWGEMSHALAYKSSLAIPNKLRRRLNLVSGLLEVADEQFLTMRDQIVELPGAQEEKILRILEPAYYRLTGRVFDPYLSIGIIGHLISLYTDDELTNLGSTVEAFVQRNEERLKHVFDTYGSTADHSVLLFQPEMLLIVERLEADQFRLVERWSEVYPSGELERLAIHWGQPLT